MRMKRIIGGVLRIRITGGKKRRIISESLVISIKHVLGFALHRYFNINVVHTCVATINALLPT